MAITATRDGTLRLPGPVRLTARSLKCTLVLSAEELVSATRTLPDVRVPVQITVGDRRLTASLNAKSVRKALATIHEHGPDAVAVIIQGKLVGDAITEAGIVAQPKVKQNHAPDGAREGGHADAA